MRLKHFIIGFISILLVAGCKKEFVIDIPNNPIPVVNCLLHPDSLWKLNLVWSSSPTGIYQFTSISGAQVLLKWPGENLTLDHFVDGRLGFYTSPDHTVPSLENSDISLEIRVGDTILTAITRIPPKPIVNLVVLSIQLTPIQDPVTREIYAYGVKGNANLTITRPPGGQRFYSLSAGYKPYTGSPSDSSSLGNKVFQDNLSMIINDPRCITSISVNEGYLFDFGLVESTSTEVLIDFTGGIWYPYEPFDYFTLVVRSLTEEYFQYDKKIRDQYISSRDPFGEPVKIPSNIQNGLGIFSGINSTCLQIRVK
ncbi:MAG: DUF4249 family protein [Porphyromonadaceae bacterium]|nr:MAG: DUF4249 family protein [Porphyromonadaceae bacterium]